MTALLLAAIALAGLGIVRKIKPIAVAGPVAGGLGLGLLLFAAPLSRLGQPEISVPSPEAICGRMTELSSKLEPFEKSRRKETIVAEFTARALATGPKVSSRSVRNAIRQAKGGAPGPGKSPDDRVSVATELLDASNQCLAWSPTAQMADLARRNFTRAIAQLSDTVFCHAASDCSVLGKACDAFTQVCLDWGVYCDNHSDCSGNQACGLDRHRCVAPDRPCNTPNDCSADYACDWG